MRWPSSRMLGMLLLFSAGVSALGIAVHSTHGALKPGPQGIVQAQHIRGISSVLNSRSSPSSLSTGTSSSSSGLPVYPKGDCVTECSVDPAGRMAHCPADAAAGIPATRCQTVGGGEDTCPSLRYPDAFSPEAYCMPQFNLDCLHPDNFGCARRCALYMIVTYNCMADAYFPSNRTFNPHCVACNMCWDKSRDQRHAAQQAPYALVWARGPSGALFVNHWLVLPKQACSGIESTTPGCTDGRGEYIWANAFHEAQRLGFSYSGGEPTWGLWLNAPNRRGVHQMHIHIAHWESSRAVAGVPFENWLARRVAAATDVSSDPRSPTRILGEGYYNPAAWVHTPLGRPPRNWARAYAIHVASSDPVNDLGRVIKPFELARQIAAASDLPSHGYGIVIMPRTLGPGPQQQQQQQHQQQGLLIAAVWSTSDSEQLDETEMQGDPIRYTHTCHQYISVDQQPSM